MDERYDVSVRGTQNLEMLFCVGTDMVQIFADKINVHRYIADACVLNYVIGRAKRNLVDLSLLMGLKAKSYSWNCFC